MATSTVIARSAIPTQGALPARGAAPAHRRVHAHGSVGVGGAVGRRPQLALVPGGGGWTGGRAARLGPSHPSLWRRQSAELRLVPAFPPAGGPAPSGEAAVAQPRPAQCATGPDDRRRLRLTRRGRLVFRAGALVLAAGAVLLAVLMVSRPAAAGSPSGPVQVRYHVVLPGETLWSIAGEVAPRVDRREVIAEIVELNALPDSGVLAGQRIALPPTS
jgi:hypothetical protein